MTVSIPLIALVAIVAYIAYRHMGLRAWHAIVCALLGSCSPRPAPRRKSGALSPESFSGSSPPERGDAR
jgi:hypothetical protein